MRKGIIKDPKFSVYKKGGNVEKPMEAKGDGSAKKELMKLAKDEADILFDLENDIVEQLKLDYLKEGGKGQTFMDWLKSKPESYLRNLPIGLAAGGKVISISEYLKQKEKPRIKKLNLDAVAPGKALSELTLISYVIYFFSGQYKSLIRYVGSKAFYPLAFRNLLITITLSIFINLFLRNHNCQLTFWRFFKFY